MLFTASASGVCRWLRSILVQETAWWSCGPKAIARRDRTVTRYTYSQAYTPLTKALDPSAFKNRPFLLALLLGKDHIKEQPDLSHIYNSTAKLLEYQQIQEAIGMELTKSEARLEFVLCAPRIEELFSINPATISHQVCSNKLLIKVRTYYLFFHSQFLALFLQVPRDDMKSYAKKVFNDLIQPLKAAITH